MNFKNCLLVFCILLSLILCSCQTSTEPKDNIIYSAIGHEFDYPINFSFNITNMEFQDSILYHTRPSTDFKYVEFDFIIENTYDKTQLPAVSWNWNLKTNNNSYSQILFTGKLSTDMQPSEIREGQLCVFIVSKGIVLKELIAFDNDNNISVVVKLPSFTIE